MAMLNYGTAVDQNDTSIYTDVTTGECKCRLACDTDEHTGASKVITRVRGSCRRLACLGVDEYGEDKRDHLAVELTATVLTRRGRI
jgi:hypothetical protein